MALKPQDVFVGGPVALHVAVVAPSLIGNAQRLHEGLLLGGWARTKSAPNSRDAATVESFRTEALYAGRGAQYAQGKPGQQPLFHSFLDRTRGSEPWMDVEASDRSLSRS